MPKNFFRRAGFSLCFLAGALAAVAAPFTPLMPLPAPRIVEASKPYTENHYDATNLLDGEVRTEYAANSTGTNTVVEFDFGKPTALAAFRHVERLDSATIAGSELDFLNADGTQIASLPVQHVNKRGGETFFIFPSPVTAQRVKWRVTKLGSNGLTAVGGAEITFFSNGQNEPTPAHDLIEVQALSLLETNGAAGIQPVRIVINHFYPNTNDATLRFAGADPVHITLKPGRNAVNYKLPASKVATTENLSLEIDGAVVSQKEFIRKPVRPLTIYVLPHSHTDIGYTEIQTAVQAKQVNNLVEGIAAAKRTANYPPGARYVWNVEVAWAADLYLSRMSEAQRQEFFDAVKKGWVGLDGMYLNELTGLCRPEELLRLFRFGTQLGERCGVPVDAAMVSDVPGYTWGTVTAMAQAGIKYLSAAPNYFDRIGDILVQNENKPFYWVSPSGKEKVLFWIPLKGYALSHIILKLSPDFIGDYESDLDKANYPYDISYIRWAGHGDNATPDPEICDFIKNWNAKHIWPQFVIATTHDAFSNFEQRYGSKIPRLRGDLTPYWEDGAASSALETLMNRANADRLTQGEALWTLFNPAGYPATDFNEAWRNVLLYSEHTWGADISVSAPESKKTKEQWEIKRGYAVDAEQESTGLLAAADKSVSSVVTSGVDIFNTTSWPRAEIVTLSREQSQAGDRVIDEHNQPVPSQRLASGELTVRVNEIPPFASRRYTVSTGDAFIKDKTSARGSALDNGIIHLEIDPVTGGIAKLTMKGIDGNLVDTSSGEQLNEYLFLLGNNLADLQTNGPVTIIVKETGPLVASLLIESGAPGCNKLTREVRLSAGADYVEILDTVDKKRAAIPEHPTDWHFAQKEGKESVNFAFPFNIPNGDLKMDVPFGVLRPEVDQLPGSCKNWFPVNRWVDVANGDYGVAWVTLDAPLIEVGEMSARLLGSQTNPDVWRKHVERTQKFYSWVMNNHWGTNYRGYQEGPVTFRYFLRPHHRTNPADISRFAIGFSQPLVVEPASPSARKTPLLEVSSPDVLVTSLKPSDDHQAWIVRLFEASGSKRSVRLKWNDRQPKAVYLSGTDEKAGRKIDGRISLAGFELETLRVEF